MSETVLTGIADGILTITINKADRLNALDAATARTIYEALLDADTNPDVRVVVLTGAGRGFSAGADLQRDKDAEADPSLGNLLDYCNLTTTLISRLTKPVISAVNGVAAGVGVSYALAADITIAKESASFLLAFSRIGLMPDGGANLWVAANIGRARAMDMALLAEQIPAPQARDWGMISRVVADDDFEAEVAKVAAKLASGPTRSYAQTKAAINKAALTQLDVTIEREVAGQTQLLQTKDNAEGVAAFLEKRPAKFTGQ
ncbi:enoyl-CoA hydratase [Cumulibacter soli]|uniref:enoyl-CoA hydratase n=1 Tax=Cumulibacter soli TaxID=2546344 RepID=UPI0010679192|nr:enoyl-CoA hydratase [Cumulibacter soli]